jgi:ribonuclease P protein component
MLPSSQRLSRQHVTTLLATSGLKVVFNRIGTLKFIPSTTSAFSVVTGSKNQKKAVARNKVRRQLYTLFRTYENPRSITGMLYVSKQIYEMSYQEIKYSFHELLSKAEKNS